MNKKVLSIVAIVVLVAILSVALVACSASSYEKKLEKAGYTVVSYDAKEAREEMGVDNEDDYTIKWVVMANKGLNGGSIAKFATASQAKAYVEEFGGLIGAFATIERSGSIVFVGTSQFVKDAK